MAITGVAGAHSDPAHRAGSDGYYQPYSNDFTGMEGAWTAEKDGPQPHSQVHIDWDVQITMSDGVVLKANIYRPMDDGIVVTEPLPVVLNITPYAKWMYAIASKLINAPGIQDGIMRAIGSLESSDPALKNFMQMLQVFDGGMAQADMADKQLIKSGYVIDAGLTPPPYDVRDVALLFGRDNTFYPEHLDIDPASPSWISIPASDRIE